MKQPFLTLSIACAAGFLVAALGANRASSESTDSKPSAHYKIPSHIPPFVKKLLDQGTLPDDHSVPLTLSLRLNNEDELDQRLAEMYRTGSPTYHQFMKPGEFDARYAPTQEQVARVQDYLRRQGIAPGSVSSGSLLIHAAATAGAVKNAFKTELHRYSTPSKRLLDDTKTYFALTSDPQLPPGLHIQAIHGLQNITRSRSHLRRRPSRFGTGTGNPTGSPVDNSDVINSPSDAYGPADIHSLYNLPYTNGGQGQDMAFFELDGYAPGDIATYEENFKIPAIPLTNILVDGVTGVPGPDSDEVTEDIEVALATAPQLDQVLVYETSNDDQAQLDMWSRIASDDIAHVISTSWGLAEDETSLATMQAENTIFKKLAAQGQAIFVASGDDGAYDDDKTLSVDDPSSQPYAVAVGGTSLQKFIVFGGRWNETVWNSGSSQDGASGGGVSSIWPRPSWQAGLAEADAQTLGSTTMRNVPDVSLNADPNNGYAFYYQGKWREDGGTSFAAPIWAAFTAIANSMRESNGLNPLGFPAAEFYRIARSNRYREDFFDITSGDNLHYPATPGFDNATGWGSFNGSNLLQDLTQDPSPAQSPAQTPAQASGPASPSGSLADSLPDSAGAGVSSE